MLSYHDLKLNPRVLRAFTSLDPEEFEILLIPFEKAWQDYIHRHYIHKKSRKRRYGGGRKPHLVAIEDKLLFILFYFKVYPLQEVIARIFGMSQGRANEWLYKLTPILETALGEAQCLPERDPQNLEQVLALCVAVDFMIDGTERPIQRPTDPIEQKDQYSGKKKRHTVKNNLIGDVEDRLVRYLSETYPGRVHDKRICEAEELVFPSDIGLFQDTGFQGYHPAGVHIYQPKKKPKGKELTPEEKAENTIISSIRILIEHIIAGVKRCRIVKDVLRNTKLYFADQVMEIACGLHNFRTTLRYNRLE
jgi:DDE superfamily endonuclease/Helix-turn-helix of DDE superfamily endonuclease